MALAMEVRGACRAGAAADAAATLAGHNLRADFYPRRRLLISKFNFSPLFVPLPPQHSMTISVYLPSVEGRLQRKVDIRNALFCPGLIY